MISITLFLVIVIGFIGVVLKEAFSVPVEGIETSNQSFNRKRYPKDVNHNPNDLVILSPAQKITQLKDCTKPNISHSKTLQWDKRFLGQLDWKLFEDISMEYLRIKNCDAAVTCTGADGGVDIKVKDNNDNVIALAQCKAWSKPIGVNLIRELFGVMASERVKHGIFLTTSIFSNEARQFAQGKPLVLIDGEEFIKNINALDHNDKKRINQLVDDGSFSTPTCVHCNVKLVKRTTKSGPKAGRIFWGCVNYPRCKITMNIAKE